MALDVIRTFVAVRIDDMSKTLIALTPTERTKLASEHKASLPGFASDLAVDTFELISNPRENWQSYRRLFESLAKYFFTEQELVILTGLELSEGPPAIE